MSQGRDLTPREEKAVALLKALEYVTDSRKLTVELNMVPAAMEVVVKIPTLRLLKKELDATRGVWIVKMTTPDYLKYVQFAIAQTGMHLMIDGSLLTHDNLVISNNYLNG